MCLGLNLLFHLFFACHALGLTYFTALVLLLNVQLGKYVHPLP